MIAAIKPLAWFAACLALYGFEDDELASRIADQAALKPFADLVGSWKGTGLKQRGSAKGAWTESATWEWHLSKDSAALQMKVEKGKYVESATLHPGKSPQDYVMDVVLAGGKTRTFAGKAGPQNVLTLKSVDPGVEGLSRITFTPLHETRLLVLLEARTAAGGTERLGEVGYTRAGVNFALGDSSPVCIVTGGRGTIAVSHQGKTYYVCCSGCKDLFEDDPGTILDEYAARKTPK